MEGLDLMDHYEAMQPEDLAEARRVLEALIVRCEAGELDATEAELLTLRTALVVLDKQAEPD